MDPFRPRATALALLLAAAAALPSSCATRSQALSGSPSGGAGEQGEPEGVLYAEPADIAFPGGGSGEAEPPPVDWANALARLPSATPEAYPDADEVSLFEWEDTRYETNGTYATTWTSLSKILTQRGLENNRTFSFANNDFYGSTTVLVARIRTPGAPPRDVDLAANLAEAVDTGSLASNIHDPNDKTFTLAFPDLQVGDAVELTMRRVAKKPRCEGVYSDYLTFESDHPILFQGARIEGPASMPLRSRAFRDAGPVKLEHFAETNAAAGTIAEVWTAGETPRFFAEPDMPPAYDCTARLLLSTAPDWESLSRWYARLCAPHLAATNEAMALKVAELVASATNSATGGPGDGASCATDELPAIREDADLAPAVRAAAAALGSGTRVFLPAPRAGEGVASFGCAGGPHGLLQRKGLDVIREEFARVGIPLADGCEDDGFFRPPNIRDEIDRRSAWLQSHPDAGREGTPFDPPDMDAPVPVRRRFDFATPDGTLAVEFLSDEDHRSLESEEPGNPDASFTLSTGEDFDFPLRTSRFAASLRLRREGPPLLVAVFFEPFGDDPERSLRRQVRDFFRMLQGDSVVLEDAPAPNPGASTRAAVVRALFDFVSREVRYMGAMAESEAPGYEPHDVSLTFDNRYGVCRDKAALLVAMLRMAGIDAWPVLINVGPRKDAQVPQPYFNHAIVAADSGDPADPYLLMDPTSETTRSLLPEYLCEMSYLVARDDGETIRETPPLPVEENLLRAHTVFTLNDDASADVKTTLSFLGVNDAAYRGYFASIARDSIRAFFERLLQGVPGAVLTRWELRPAPEDLRKSPEPLVATVEYAIAEAARVARGDSDGAGGEPAAALLDLPDLAGSLAIASRVVGDLGLEKRRFPLVTDYPCGFEETVELRTPPDIAVASAPDVTFPGESHAESAKSAESDLDLGFVDNCGQLGFVNNPSVLFQDRPTPSGRFRSLKLFRSRYSPEEYQTLREARVAEERAGCAPILLEGEGVSWMFGGRGFGDGLSNVLARAVEPAPTDDLYTEFSRTTVDVSRAPEEWTVETTTRRRILTYAGQRKAGDVTLRWNPATTDLLVTNACVILPDGTATPVDPKLDLFEGDQEWVADAPRYPAGKIATVSFPKLAPGCAVEWTVVRRAHDRDLFSFAETLGSCGSFGEISVTVAGTNGTARSFRVDDPYWKTIADRFPVETNETDSATTYTVRGGGPGSQIVAEPNMPPMHRLAPVLRASSQTAPERARALAARMWALSDPAVQTNAAALARSLVPKGFGPNERRTILAREYSVVDPGKGPGAAVFAIRDWCAVNLREAGPAYWDLPLSALSPADATLAARYGHEADIRILQLAMLRALGFCGGLDSLSYQTGMRLYNADWDGAPPAARDLSFASPSTFDTIDFSVPEATWGPLSVIGSCRWSLDGATQYAPPLACRNEGRAYLFVRLPPSGPEGPDRVSVARADSLGPGNGWGPDYPGQSGTETEYTIRVREDGSAEIGVSVSHSGSDYEAFRKRYEEILPEERRRDAQRLAAAISQSAKLKGDVETLTPPNGPCTKLLFAVEVPDFAVRDGDRLVFRLPGALSLSPQARERRFPFRRASDDLSCTACSVWVPFGWRVAAAPAAIRFGDPATKATYEREVSDDEPAGLLWVRTRRRLERAEFDAALFPAFQADCLVTRGPDAETVVLERAPSAD